MLQFKKHRVYSIRTTKHKYFSSNHSFPKACVKILLKASAFRVYSKHFTDNRMVHCSFGGEGQEVSRITGTSV